MIFDRSEIERQKTYKNGRKIKNKTLNATLFEIETEKAIELKLMLNI